MLLKKNTNISIVQCAQKTLKACSLSYLFPLYLIVQAAIELSTNFLTKAESKPTFTK